MHRGEVPDRPEQAVPLGVVDPGVDHLSRVLLQSRGVQTSTPVSEVAGADGSDTPVSGVCPPSHSTHPVVSQAALDRGNSWVAASHVCQQGYRPDAQLVVGFMSPNTTITMDASMEGWGGHCLMPGSGTALYSGLWIREECQLHINVFRAQGCPSDLSASEAGGSRTVST